MRRLEAPVAGSVRETALAVFPFPEGAARDVFFSGSKKTFQRKPKPAQQLPLPGAEDSFKSRVRREWHRFRHDVRQNKFALMMAVLAMVGGGSALQAHVKYRAIAAHENYMNEVNGFSYRYVRFSDGSVGLVPFTISAELLARTANASAMVIGPNGQGSGVFLQSRTGEYYLLTNHHVTDGNSWDGADEPARLSIIPYGQEGVVDGVVVYSTGSPDLALLKIVDPNFQPPHALRRDQIRNTEREPLKEMEPMHLVGNPRGEKDRVRPGFLHFEFLQDYVQFITDCDHGTSGGPLFDQQGRLIGVQRAIAEDIAHCYGVPVSRIERWLRRAGFQFANP